MKKVEQYIDEWQDILTDINITIEKINKELLNQEYKNTSNGTI